MTISDREAARRAARGEALCAATVRALTGDAALHYSGSRLCRNMRPLPLHAPHLQTLPTPHDPFRSLRGAADGAALRLRHSDAALHRSLLPDSPLERLIFELLEQLRCETFVPPGMPGIAKNLRERFEAWSRAVHETGVADSHVGLLLYTVAQMSWSRLTTYPVIEETEGLIEATRMAIAPRVGGALAGMRRTRADQAAFAVYARELAAEIAAMIRSASGEAADADTKDEEDQKGVRNAFSLFLDFDEKDEDGIRATASLRRATTAKCMRERSCAARCSRSFVNGWTSASSRRRSTCRVLHVRSKPHWPSRSATVGRSAKSRGVSMGGGLRNW
jgi:cobaltochelatase CobT